MRLRILLICIFIVTLYCLSATHVLADSNYVGIASRVTGDVMMETDKEESILKGEGFVNGGARVKTENNSSLEIILAPEIVFGEEFKSTIRLSDSTELLVDVDVAPPYYYVKDSHNYKWWEIKDEDYCSENKIKYSFKVYSGKVNAYLNTVIFEYIESLVFNFGNMSMIPLVNRENTSLIFSMNVKDDCQLGEDFTIADIVADTVLGAILMSYGVDHFDDLSEEGQQEYITILELLYPPTTKYKVIEIKVESGKLEANSKVINEGEKLRFAVSYINQE